jgi:hypothetical protein
METSTKCARCTECQRDFNKEDLRDIGFGNAKKYICDDCYEKLYEGRDEDDDDSSFSKFDYVPGDPHW